MTKDQILKEFDLYAYGHEGIGAWINHDTQEEIFQRLGAISTQPLSKVQLNQLLVLGKEASLSDDFFKYYWLRAPQNHPYPVEKLPGFDPKWTKGKEIQSLPHLKWGLHRLYIDGLLFFGNVRTAYRQLRSMTRSELKQFFGRKRFPTHVIKERGPALPLEPIPKDNRYLIAEMACKTYGDPAGGGDLKAALLDSYKAFKAFNPNNTPSIRDLLQGNLEAKFSARQNEFLFSADDVLDESVDSESKLDASLQRVIDEFEKARKAALSNTYRYLSMVSDLDVYVATSMRTRDDFRKMADFCDQVFADLRLKGLNLRYFDPTLSAAAGHEDKGLIECLMVKSAKVLVFCAGKSDSYGKDAEAAMALSLGKPVIFFCDTSDRGRFYKDVHPLVRLIEFSTGIAVGGMVTDKVSEVQELLHRLFENKMEYELEQKKPGYFRLLERLTGSVVRLQTSDRILSETFWNHYHNRPIDENQRP